MQTTLIYKLMRRLSPNPRTRQSTIPVAHRARHQYSPTQLLRAHRCHPQMLTRRHSDHKPIPFTPTPSQELQVERTASLSIDDHPSLSLRLGSRGFQGGGDVDLSETLTVEHAGDGRMIETEQRLRMWVGIRHVV
jgi:hypothetical protein